ncbi:MAG: hypothetical protein AAGC99_20410, partial [Pseudomonadota bacterium]
RFINPPFDLSKSDYHPPTFRNNQGQDQKGQEGKNSAPRTSAIRQRMLAFMAARSNTHAP